MEYNLEFDGTTVLCCVCGDKSSGFHYGVHSCEGCKGFFRRSIQQKIQYRPCTKNQQCSILRINRNRCQYCRLKKCIAVGMSRDAVRFGRVPKREKAKILAAMQSKNQSNQDKLLTEQLLDEQAMLNAIFKAHNDTCDFTHSKMAPIFLRAEQNPIFADYPSQMTCPLNPLSAPSSPDSTQINDSFSPAICGVVQFARNLPGFSSLPNEDQVTLLKAGVFEALLVRLAVLFRSSEKMYCLNGQILRRSDAVDSSQNGRFLFECMFEFGERVNALRLTDEDIALFSAVVLVTPDRPGLRNIELVQKIHHKLDQLLMNQMASNHPEEPNLYTELKKKIPDLRTLNTLHSEKLLAVKMDSPNVDGVSTSGSSSSTPNYSYAEYYSTNSFKCNQSVTSDWSDFGSPRSVGSSCDNESTSTKALDMCPYSPSEQMAQFHLSNQTVNGQIASSNSNQLTSNLVVSSNNSVSSPGSSNSSAGQISSHRTSSSLSNFSSSSNHSYTGALALHSSGANSVSSLNNNNNNPTSTAPSSSNERSSTVINKPRFGQLNCFNNNLISSGTQQNATTTDEEKLAGLIMNRRVDSPTDSGIESGKDGNCSATSVCSSPRSDSEDHHLHHNNQTSQTNKNQKITTSSSSNSSVINSNNSNGSIDDMPMLKRALQAPPILNTTSLLMDEAYRHHKKFRATKMQQAQRELEAQSPQSSTHSNLSSHDELAQQSNHSNNNSNNQSLASSHSTLVKTLQQQPRFANEQQLKRTDLIHTIIMRGESDLHPSSTKQSTFGLLDNSPHSTSSSLNGNSLTNQSRSSIIHTATSNQSTLQQLLAPNKPSSSSMFGSTFGSAPSPLKYNNHHISPSSPSSLVNQSSSPNGLLLNHPSIFHYSTAQHQLPHHHLHNIYPAHHHSSTAALLMEAQPLDLSNSKKSSPITPSISPKIESN